MTTEPYGIPNKNDPTSRLERWIDEAAQKLTKQILEDGPKAITRPPGVKERPIEQQLNRYKAMREDPLQVVTHLMALEQQMGSKNAARIELVRWARQMMAEEAKEQEQW